MDDMPSCFGTVKSPQDRAENDCVTCRYVRQCDTVETEIRSLREQVAQERAGREQAILEGMEMMREAAAKWAEDDAKLCDCEAHSESECACGAWCEWKTVPMHHVVQAIRNLDPTTILEAHTRAKAKEDQAGQPWLRGISDPYKG